MIKILITGDFFGGNRIEELIRRNDFNLIFNDFTKEINSVDIAITNLESPLTEEKNKIDKTGPSLKSLPKTIKALKFAGFNIVTLANNHIKDYGVCGLNDTIKLCKKEGIEYVGVGKNIKKATKPLHKEIYNKKITFINIAENEWGSATNSEAGANPLNPISNYYSINESAKKADYVFVIVHGGHEMYKLPSPRVKELYRFFIDAGASSVIGHHPHCFSGYEIYKKKPIFYSLGNFVFDNSNYINSAWNFGYAVKFILVNNELNFEIIPYSQCDGKPGVFKLDNKQYQLFIQKIESLSKTILDNELLLQKFKEFCTAKSKTYNNYIEPYSNKYLHALRNQGYFPSLLSKKKKLLYLNLLRCESLREVTQRILENENSNT